LQKNKRYSGTISGRDQAQILENTAIFDGFAAWLPDFLQHRARPGMVASG
jgi:hypothetical protein